MSKSCNHVLEVFENCPLCRIKELEAVIKLKGITEQKLRENINGLENEIKKRLTNWYGQKALEGKDE